MQPAIPSTTAQTSDATVTMPAAVLTGDGGVEVRQAVRPTPGPDEVRVRLEGCGVCTSDLPVWEGRRWFEYPQAPGASGHEGWGQIEALGENVDGLAVGDRVAVLSYRAYAACDVARADEVVTLPPELDDRPFPGEPLGCAMNVVRRSGIEPGHTVAIVGVGFLGALLVGLADTAGARVLAGSRRPFARAMAERFGAATTFAMDEPEHAEAAVMTATGGEGCDVVIEATGKQAALDLASRLVRVRGCLVIAGYHQDGTRTVDMQRWNWRGIDVINAHERDPQQYVRGMRAAVAAVVNGRIDPTPLYTHILPLHELSDAFRLIRERPHGFMKALVRVGA